MLIKKKQVLGYKRRKDVELGFVQMGMPEVLDLEVLSQRLLNSP